MSARVISLLDLDVKTDQPIFLGQSNVEHMIRRHRTDYEKYGQHIPLILAQPDYVGKSADDGSIEYVKEFQVDGNFVKVAVRVSASNTLYARTVYVLNANRVRNFIQKGTLKKVSQIAITS